MGEKLEATACKLAIRKSFYFILWIRRGVDFIFSTESTVFRFRMQMETGMRVRVLNELAVAPAALSVGRTEWALFVIPFRGCFSLFTLYSMCVLCAGVKAGEGWGWCVDFSFFTLLFDVYSGNVFNFIAEFIASQILVYFQAISRAPECVWLCVCVYFGTHTHPHTLRHTYVYVYIIYERAYAVTILFVKHSTHIENWISRGRKILYSNCGKYCRIKNERMDEKKKHWKNGNILNWLRKY